MGDIYDFSSGKKLGEKEESNVIPFPKIVKIASLTNEGVFTLTVDNMCDVNVNGSSIYIWFSEGREEGRPWDLSLEYSSPKEAAESFKEMAEAIKEIRFREFNKGGEVIPFPKRDN